jgi:hypothetical protein
MWITALSTKSTQWTHAMDQKHASPNCFRKDSKRLLDPVNRQSSLVTALSSSQNAAARLERYFFRQNQFVVFLSDIQYSSSVKSISQFKY